MRPLNARIPWEVVLGIVVGACLVVILRQSRRIAEYQRHQAADAQSLRLLQEALRQKGIQQIPSVVPEETLSGNNRAGIAKREQVIARLDRELAESRSTVTNLQTQLSASNDQIAKAAASAEERLQKQQADSKAQLDDLQKKLEAARAELDIIHQRLAVVEADNSQMKTDSTASAARAADVARIISSLQDMDRRREVYLTSILRRYRDITGEFRAMTGMLDTGRDANAGACDGAALSRIQSAVTSAEDDLRQVSELDARSLKLEKQLLKK
jgi:chromosome segregation ATPase